MADKTILNIGQVDEDGKSSKSYKFILEDEEARSALYGMHVGQEFNGELVSEDLAGYKFKITGGSNADGTPMRGDLEGPDRKRILFKERTVGFKPKRGEKGVRKRKLVRGNEIQDDIVQLNLKVLEKGSNPLQ